MKAVILAGWLWDTIKRRDGCTPQTDGGNRWQADSLAHHEALLPIMA